MGLVPSEKRYEKYIQDELISILDDGLKFNYRIHKKNDKWYDKNSCLLEMNLFFF